MSNLRDSYRPDSGMALDSDSVKYDWVQALKNMQYQTERGAVPTVWSDPINRLETIFAVELFNTVTLATDAVFDSRTVTFETGHNFVVGNQFGIANVVNPLDPHLYIGTVLSVATNTITLDSPIDFEYKTTDFSFRGSDDVAVDGSSTTKMFIIQPPIGFNWDITRVMFSMIDSSTPDDSKFGGADALTNGLVLRLCRNYGTEYYNLANFKTNGDIANYAYDVSYTTRSGGQGSYGVRSRLTFSGPEKMGSVIRLRGGDNPQAGPQDQLQILVQDNLTVLDSFKILFQGHWVDVNWNGPV